jgi:hypothetical protein
LVFHKIIYEPFFVFVNKKIRALFSARKFFVFKKVLFGFYGLGDGLPATGPLVCWTLAMGGKGDQKGCYGDTEEKPFNYSDFRNNTLNF